MTNFELWMNYKDMVPELKQELLEISGNQKEIDERFSTTLEFGTGGIRGIMGAGPGRMNIYTVRRATAGLANYILDQGGASKGVVIAYDSRNKSDLFASESARVLAAYGIKVYLFSGLRPTPELSFAVRHLGAAAGVVVTASHNPPKYNGYKVYGEDGGQITNHAADAVCLQIEKIDIFNIKLVDFDQAVENGDIQIIGEDVDDAFLDSVYKMRVNTDIDSEIKVVYTPLHGSGNIGVRRILKMIGLSNVQVVAEQELPDGNFPTVKSPNPEEKEGFTLAINMAKESGAELIIGTDPDCDRIGVVCKDKEGEFVVLTGNQTGLLLANYIITCSEKPLAENPCLVSTIVSTSLTARICEKHGIYMEEVLTGFKFIGEKIKEYEQTGDKSFIFGFEESYGYLAGSYARDKDAVLAAMLICEMAAYFKKRGKTLYDVLIDIFGEYGYYAESVVNVVKEGISGAAEIAAVMERFRGDMPTELGGMRVVSCEDFKTGEGKDLVTGKQYQMGLPSSNVLKYKLENDCWMALRPSGTEPKLKLYFGVIAEDINQAKEALKKLTNDPLFKL